MGNSSEIYQEIEDKLRILLYTPWEQNDKYSLPYSISHYTSQKAFLSIFQNKELWLTHFKFMNDASEYDWALRQTIEILENKLYWDGQAKPKDVFELVIERIKNLLNPDQLSKEQLYIASFSKLGNDLSQWRGYGEDSAGVCFGIDPHRIKLDFFPARTKRFFSANGGFIKVLYDYEDIKNEVEKMYDKIKNYISRDNILELLPLGENAKKLSYLISELFLERCIALKNDLYRCEQEIRLVRRFSKDDSQEILYRDGKYGITPYIRIPLLDEKNVIPFTTIYPGPKQKEDAVYFLRKMLLDKGYAYSENIVQPSKIPERRN